ncbi:acyltransferase (plasmid) [Pedobacter sp. BS3]|nr:acyltransferase [Pedobacter sp. BS3]
MVVFFHLNEPIPYIHNFYRSIVKLGHIGVPVFFVISGYCILLATRHCKNSLEFISRRCFRIFPTYWFSLAIVLAVAIFQKLTLGNNSVAVFPHTISDALKTIFILTKPFGSTTTINWVYWSLTCELFFYFIIGLGLLFGSTAQLFYFIGAISLVSIFIDPNLSAYLFWVPYWHTFALGAGIYYLHSQKLAYYRLTLLLLIFCLVGLYLFHYKMGYYAYVTATFASGILIYLSPYLNQYLNEKVQRLGDLSYSVYLIHVPIGVYLLGLLKNNFIQTHITANILFDSGVYLIVLYISYYIYTYIESPAIIYGKHFIKKRV